MDATWASSRSPVGPSGSYHCHGLRHSPGTCAAGSPLARPWGRAFPSRVGQTLQPRIAPPRPTDATHPASIAGGAADPNPTCGRAAGHASGFGRGALGTGARPWGARVRPGTEPHPCVSPRRRVADLQACAHPTLTLTLTLTDTFRAVITGHGPGAHGGVGGVMVSVLRLLGHSVVGTATNCMGASHHRSALQPVSPNPYLTSTTFEALGCNPSETTPHLGVASQGSTRFLL